MNTDTLGICLCARTLARLKSLCIYDAFSPRNQFLPPWEGYCPSWVHGIEKNGHIFCMRKVQLESTTPVRWDTPYPPTHTDIPAWEHLRTHFGITWSSMTNGGGCSGNRRESGVWLSWLSARLSWRLLSWVLYPGTIWEALMKLERTLRRA